MGKKRKPSPRKELTSEQLNDLAAELCCEKTQIGYECWANSGKVIPYIGWFWRTINFDAETERFGVIPPWSDLPHVPEKDRGGHQEPLVGFMGNNKWGHPEIEADEWEWGNIKALLAIAVATRAKEDFHALNLAIQELSKKTWEAAEYW